MSKAASKATRIGATGIKAPGTPAQRPAGLELLDLYARWMREKPAAEGRPSLLMLLAGRRAELAEDPKFQFVLEAEASARPSDGASWYAGILDALEEVSRRVTGRYLRRLAGDDQDLEIEGEPLRIPEGTTDRLKIPD
jgi:hypothetical protein